MLSMCFGVSVCACAWGKCLNVHTSSIFGVYLSIFSTAGEDPFISTFGLYGKTSQFIITIIPLDDTSYFPSPIMHYLI